MFERTRHTTQTILEWLVRVLLAIGVIFIVALMVIGTIDSLGQKFFKFPVPAAYEAIGALCAGITFVFLVVVQLRARQINVELLTQRLPVKGKQIVHFVSTLLSFLVLGLFCWSAWPLTVSSLAKDEVSMGMYRFPIYPTKLVIAIGLSLVVTVSLIVLVRDARGFFAKNKSTGG